MISTLFGIIIAYLLGSISSGVIVAKIFKLPDPRSQGSKSAGATNTTRISGMKPGLLVLGGDFVKGMLSVIIAIGIGANSFALGLVALACVIGHVFPVYFKFKGGKGIATSAGALAIISLWTLIVAILVWVAVVYITRYISMGSVIASIATPFLLLVGGNYEFSLQFVAIALLIIFTHRSNIDRVRHNKEDKIESICPFGSCSKKEESASKDSDQKTK